jgi:hypothetical protein
MKDERKTLHEFVIEEFEINMGSKFSMDCINDVLKYSNLTNRAPKLGDFVPTDEEGNVLEKYKCEVEDYEQALSRVIFEGFEVVYADESHVSVIMNKGTTLIHFRGDVCLWTKEIGTKEITRIEELPKEITFKDGVV